MEPEAAPSRQPYPQYVVRASEQPIVDQSDPDAEAWIAAGGDPRDQGRMMDLISRELTGAEHFMLGIAWFTPGDVSNSEAATLWWIVAWSWDPGSSAR